VSKSKIRCEAEMLAVKLCQRSSDENWPFFECFSFTFLHLAEWIVFELGVGCTFGIFGVSVGRSIEPLEV
jgi:hypothetical protein